MSHELGSDEGRSQWFKVRLRPGERRAAGSKKSWIPAFAEITEGKKASLNDPLFRFQVA